LADEREDGLGFAVMRLMINLGALGVSAAIVALIVATIAVEID
jgi:hypothetical protein